MTSVEVEIELLPPLIERLKQLHAILERNRYISDATRRLKQMIDDSERPAMILFIGKERVGKTTLINALLGREILPSSDVNPTAVNTFIRFAEQEEIKVYFKDGMVASFDIDQLELLSTSKQFASQILREHLDYIELFLNIELLQQVTLVDSTALEVDDQHAAYFPESFFTRADEIFWILRCGSPATDAEVSLLEKLNAKGMKPVLLANGIDYNRASLVEFIHTETEHIGHLVRSFLTVSAKEALESHFYNDSVKWYNSQFESLQNELQAISANGNKKTHKTILQLSNWLTYFYRALTSISQKEPYSSVINSLEYANSLAMNSVTRHQRDLVILSTYEDEYKHTSELFQSVETLYQLLQTIEQYPYLQDDSTTTFVELAIDYLKLAREYRTLHSEYVYEKDSLDEQHNKLYNRSIMKAILRIPTNHDEYFKERVEKLNELRAECALLLNDIQGAEKKLFNHLSSAENHLMELLKRRLISIALKAQELDEQRKREKYNYKWSIDKIGEFTCLIEAQGFIRDAISPYLNDAQLPLSEQEADYLQQLITSIHEFKLVDTQILATKQPIQDETSIVPDFEQLYPVHTLTLTNVDIKADIPTLPEVLELTYEA